VLFRSFISDCLKGICEQETDFEFEILVRDDNSTDGTRAVIEELRKQYPRKVQLFDPIEPDFQNAFPHRELTENAKGSFIAYCDGDDYWRDRFQLQKSIDTLQLNPEAIAVYSDFASANTSTNEWKLHRYPRELTINTARFVPYVPWLTLVHKKVDVPWYDKKTRRRVAMGDRYFCAELLTKGPLIKVTGIEAPVKRDHPGGEWTGRSELSRETARIASLLYLSELFALRNNMEVAKKFQQELALEASFFLSYSANGGKVSKNHLMSLLLAITRRALKSRVNLSFHKLRT